MLPFRPPRRDCRCAWSFSLAGNEGAGKPCSVRLFVTSDVVVVVAVA